MKKNDDRDYVDYDDDELLEADNLSDADIDIDELDGNEGYRFRRTWRDTEKYMEMKELYKIINDELYTGFLGEEYFTEYEDR